MTCRVDRLAAGEDAVVFRVSGQIAGEDVNVLQTLLAESKGAVRLDLKEVTIVGRSAVTLLALFERSGVELSNLPNYVREWISKENAQIARGRTERDR